MAEKLLATKTINLAANTLGTLTWTGNDFLKALPESVIKQRIAVRFSCSTTSTHPVNAGVRYTALNKQYLVAERKTLFVIPASGSVEITPASKPALSYFADWIQSIDLDLTSPVACAVTAVLGIEDAPELSADPGPYAGLDVGLVQDYIPIKLFGSSAIAGGANVVNYTVPAGKRFFIDYAGWDCPPSPANPGRYQMSIQLTYSGGPPIFILRQSRTDRFFAENILTNFNMPMLQGDNILMRVTNDIAITGGFTVSGTLIGREVF